MGLVNSLTKVVPDRQFRANSDVMGVSLINGNSNNRVKRAELRRHTVKHNVAVRLVTEANNQAAARNDLRLT